jgi:hypothetical protein
MKRHITREQLAELTDGQKAKLREVWKPQDGDFYTYDGCTDEECLLYGDAEYSEYSEESKTVWGYGFPLPDAKYTMFPLLSIGQMIELLQGNQDIVSFDYDEIIVIYKSKDLNLCDASMHHVGLCDKDICDELWQMVKEVL